MCNMKYIVLFSFFLLLFPAVVFSDDCSGYSVYSSVPLLISPGIASPVIGSGIGHGTIIHQPGVFGSSIIHQSQMTNVIDSSPELYDMNGTYRGRINMNRYDPDSISNPYGRYGNRYSPESINNRFSPINRLTPNGVNNFDSNFNSGFMRYNSTRYW